VARKATSRYMILGLLADGPKSGYDIKLEVEQAAGHFWRESFGSIYPLLDRLRREGRITVRETEKGGRGRRLYALAPSGRAELRRWLAEPVGPDVVRLELLLKLHVGGAAAPSILLGHVEAYLERQEAYRTELERLDGVMPGIDPRDRRGSYRRLTLELGRRVAAARIAWAKEARATLRRMGGAMRTR